MPEAGDELPRVIAVPSDRLWLDPPFVNRQLYTQVSDVPIPFAGAVQVAPMNAARWAIGFISTPGSGAGAAIAPWGDVTQSYGVPLVFTALQWYTLTLHGPLVTGPWFGAGGADSVCRVIEVIRQS